MLKLQMCAAAGCMSQFSLTAKTVERMRENASPMPRTTGKAAYSQRITDIHTLRLQRDHNNLLMAQAAMQSYHLQPALQPALHHWLVVPATSQIKYNHELQAAHHLGSA